MALTTVEMVSMNCGDCGIEFWLPMWFNTERQETGKGWYCPNGHCRAYRETDAQRLQRELSKERNLRIHFEKENEKKEKKLKRITNRIEKGVCVHCNRTFTNLARHMKTKHTR